LIFLLCLGAFSAEGNQNEAAMGDQTVTKVIKLLQNMLKKSKTDADTETVLYAKYTCYVDLNTKSKNAAIKVAASALAKLTNEMEKLKADNEKLGGEVTQLEADMAANQATQKKANEVRAASYLAFQAMELDLTTCTGQMNEALGVLTSISLMQDKAVVHKKELALLNTGSSAQMSLAAAANLLDSDKRALLESFLQAPLALDGKSKGDAIVAILMNLKTAFESNLNNARASNTLENTNHLAAIKDLRDAHSTMSASKAAKEQSMGEKDNTLSSKTGQFKTILSAKTDDETFLAELIKVSTKKAKNWATRKALRSQEDAAIAECVNILNSDAAFSSFGKSTATSTGSTTKGGKNALGAGTDEALVQERLNQESMDESEASFLQGGKSFLQVRQLRGNSDEQVAQKIEAILEHAAGKGHSMRIAQIANVLRKGNAFASVVKEINKMVKAIADEEAADVTNKDWCHAERTTSFADVNEKKAGITALNAKITALDLDEGMVGSKANGNADVRLGLKGTIKNAEIALASNQKQQSDETKARKAANSAYKVDVSDFAEAEDTLNRALAVLSNYYAKLAKHSAANPDSTNFAQGVDDSTNLVQVTSPAPPATYDSFGGQKKEGNAATNMIQHILTATKDEHTAADAAEAQSLKDFDASIVILKAAEQASKDAIATNAKSLADDETAEGGARGDLKDTTAAKVAVEQYIASIKEGCDFIEKNYAFRRDSRVQEKTALDGATAKIIATPEYKKAEAKVISDKNFCKGPCRLDKTSLSCKVCQSGKTKAQYCSAHAMFPGCK